MAVGCHGASHGIDPSCSRLRISSAHPRTSSYEERSRPRGFIASTSVLRNKGRMSFAYPNIWVTPYELLNQRSDPVGHHTCGAWNGVSEHLICTRAKGSENARG